MYVNTKYLEGESLWELELDKEVLDMSQKSIIHKRKKLIHWTLSKVKFVLYEKYWKWMKRQVADQDKMVQSTYLTTDLCLEYIDSKQQEN